MMEPMTDAPTTHSRVTNAAPDSASPAEGLDLAHLDWLDTSDVRARAVSYWDASPMRAGGLVRPADTAQVSAILRACHQAGQTVVTHGGRTTCVEGVNTTEADIILSTERMNRIVEIDPVEQLAVVEAGATLSAVQDAAAEAGLTLPLDLGARGSCTIGGNIATNAGGVNVIRYGMTRQQVLGLEAVLPNGDVLSMMDRVLKNNAGYDLKQMFIGSEGTLGVVTQAVLRLEPQRRDVLTAMLAAPSYHAVLSTLSALRTRFGAQLHVFELMWGAYYDAVTRPGGHRPVLERSQPFYILLELVDQAEDTAFLEFIETMMGESHVLDGAVAGSETDRAHFWTIRDDFESLLKAGPIYLYDVSLPLRQMNDYIGDVEQALAATDPDSALYVFGHIGDGNLHLFVRPSPATAEAHGRTVADRAVYEPLAPRKGSVSAEHGIGMEKKAWLSLSRQPAEIALMKAFKRAVDPAGILNPGVIFDLDAASSPL